VAARLEMDPEGVLGRLPGHDIPEAGATLTRVGARISPRSSSKMLVLSTLIDSNGWAAS
jgi:hypothetical protein